MFERRFRERRREIVRRWRRADMQFLGDLARLTNAHVQAVRAIFEETRATADGPSPADRFVAPPPQPALVIEASSGTQARGVFLIENTLSRSVESPIDASLFTDAAGRTIRAPLRLEPDVVKLDPGEEMLVTVIVDMDESVPEGVRFVGRFDVPELAETYVEAVLFRRPGDR